MPGTDAVARPRDSRRGAVRRPNPVVTLLLGIFPPLLLGLAGGRALEQAEWASYDWRMQLRERFDPRPLSDAVRLVAITKDDREWLGEDLTTRRAHGQLLDALRSFGAELALFDIFFQREAEADDVLGLRLREMPSVLGFVFNNSPGLAAPTGEPPSPELAGWAAMAHGGADAKAISRAFARELPDYTETWIRRRDELRGRTVGAEAGTAEAMRQLDWANHLGRALRERYLVLTAGRALAPDPVADPHRAKGVAVLSSRLMHRAAGLGFANIQQEESNVVRDTPLLMAYGDTVFPSMDLAALLLHYGVDLTAVEIEWGREIRFTPTRNGTGVKRIPIDVRGRYLVNYREGEPFLARAAPISDVVSPDREEQRRGHRVAESLRGAIVLVGEVIAGGTDTQPIPLQTRFPMVGMHANVVDNVLRDDYLAVPPGWVRIAGASLFGALVGLLFFSLSYWRAATLSAALVALGGVGAYFALAKANLVLPVALPAVSTGASVVLLFGYIVGVTERDRRLVRDVFLKSVSPRIGEEILRNFNDEAIWGSRRVISVLFVDIRGYTTLSESEEPEAVLELVDHFYDTVSECVFRYEGQVNKFIGDGAMALFGALPEESPDHAGRAVRAAAAIQRLMAEYAAAAPGERGRLVETGAGIATGEAVVGLVGRRRIRIEYTALGDTVNVASRLQGIAARGQIALGEGTVAGLGGPGADIFRGLGGSLSEVEGIVLKGRSQPMKVYLLSLQGSRHPGGTLGPGVS